MTVGPSYRKCARCGASFHRHERMRPNGLALWVYLCPDSASEQFAPEVSE